MPSAESRFSDPAAQPQSPSSSSNPAPRSHALLHSSVPSALPSSQVSPSSSVPSPQYAARQLVRHGHLDVDGRRVNIPSFRVRPGMEITVREKSRKNPHIMEAVEFAQGRGIPSWLELDADAFKGKVLENPTREDIRFPIQEQLIVELYSR